MMPAEGHGPADLPREATTTPGQDDALTLVVAGHDDAAKWSMPIGVRTASEWAWRAIVIAASTGGPNALMELFQALPATLHVPLFVVQHMPPMFTRMLAERLTAGGRVPVAEAANGGVVSRGRAYLAPGDFHLTVARDGPTVRLLTNKDAPENSCRPAADPLFRSAAKVYGSGTLAVVLTGMGTDGLRGCEAVRAAGGQVIAQDEATSVVWGMPGAVARAALAERLFPLSAIGPEIVRRVTGGGAA